MCELFIILVQCLVFYEAGATNYIVKKVAGWGLKCGAMFSVYCACTGL